MYNEKAFKVFSISSNFAKNILKLKKKKKNPNENNEQVLKKLPYKTLIKNRRKLFKNKGKLFKTWGFPGIKYQMKFLNKRDWMHNEMIIYKTNLMFLNNRREMERERERESQKQNKIKTLTQLNNVNRLNSEFLLIFSFPTFFFSWVIKPLVWTTQGIYIKIWNLNLLSFSSTHLNGIVAIFMFLHY